MCIFTICTRPTCSWIPFIFLCRLILREKELHFNICVYNPRLIFIVLLYWLLWDNVNPTQYMTKASFCFTAKISLSASTYCFILTSKFQTYAVVKSRDYMDAHSLIRLYFVNSDFQSSWNTTMKTYSFFRREIRPFTKKAVMWSKFQNGQTVFIRILRKVCIHIHIIFPSLSSWVLWSVSECSCTLILSEHIITNVVRL